MLVLVTDRVQEGVVPAVGPARARVRVRATVEIGLGF